MDPDSGWEMRAGYAYAAVGVCSLLAYPIGALLLKVKCGWSCVPTVSDVERPLSAEFGTEDIIRRVLMMFAVVLRNILVPAILIQVYPLLRPLSFQSQKAQLLKVAFYTSLAVWSVSDLFQVMVGNDLKHRADFTPHTIAIHIDIIALMACNIALMISLANDAETTRTFLVTGTMALLKVVCASVFLSLSLSTKSVIWQLIEWAMLGAIGGLHVSIGLAMPASLRMNFKRNFQVLRTERICPLLESGHDTMGSSFSFLPQLKRWH